MENQAEPGLCIPYDVCPAEGDFLRPVRRRHSDQEGLHCDHEEICPAEDVGEEKLVCSGLLSAWIYRWVGLAIFFFVCYLCRPDFIFLLFKRFMVNYNMIYSF